MDIEKLENEFVLTSAEYLLSLLNIKWTFTGTNLKILPHIIVLYSSFLSLGAILYYIRLEFAKWAGWACLVLGLICTTTLYSYFVWFETDWEFGSSRVDQNTFGTKLLLF